MVDWVFGTGAFAIFFLYDWNRVSFKKKCLFPLFGIGNLALGAVGVRMIMSALSAGRGGQAVWLWPGAFFLAGLIYTLYFALPFDSTYCKEADQHKVCRAGMYGWCRHPGIWWFLGCFFCLGMASGNRERMALCLFLSFLNLLYAWYQDRLIFVREFSDYGDYQNEVPFLIPQLQRRR